MVFAMFGAFIGLALGVAAGVWAGSLVFAKYFQDLDVRRFDIRADYDDNVPVPFTEGKPVPRKYRAFLKYFPNWAVMPDYYRVTWMNHVLKTLWPHYNQAIGKMVLETVTPQIDEVVKQYPFIEAIDIELIDFGTKPIRVGGVKVYNSTDDEVIMETPLTWGSNASVRASMRLRFNKWSFYIPVEISDFQMKVLARSTLRPLVDTLPCMGAVTISLTETPHLDFSLHLFSKFDLMLLPGVRELAIMTIQGVIGDMLQYPNKMQFDIMEGGGVPPPPLGMLQIKVSKVDHITEGGDMLSKVDPYVELGVREDRYQRTKTLWNTKHPAFEEVFNLIVDDPDTQTLTFKLHDDDLGFNDPVIGIVEQDLADADFIKEPKKRISVTFDFVSLPALKKMKRLVKKRTGQERQPQKLPTAGEDEKGRKQYKIPDAPEVIGNSEERKDKATVGRLYCDIIYIPFQDSRSDVKTDDPEDEIKAAEAGGAEDPQKKAVTNAFSKITDEDKGILTVTLKGCSNLQASDGGVDPYAVLTLTDPKKVKPEVQQTYMMHNEPSPHWNQKFDFAMVSATSTLAISVFDKKSTMQTVLSNPVKSLAGKVTGKPPEVDECIGTLRLKVSNVVRNERIKDTWALLETQKGDIHMTLDWRPIVVEAGAQLLEAGDQREVEQKRKQQEAEEKRPLSKEPAKPGEPASSQLPGTSWEQEAVVGGLDISNEKCKQREQQKLEGGEAAAKSPREHSHLRLPHLHLHRHKDKDKSDEISPREHSRLRLPHLNLHRNKDKGEEEKTPRATV